MGGVRVNGLRDAGAVFTQLFRRRVVKKWSQALRPVVWKREQDGVDDSQERPVRLVINGKATGDPTLREAVVEYRRRGWKIEVRATWEAGDAARYTREAVADGIATLAIAGGDGTINEVVNELASLEAETSTALGIIPYGTANDFATAAEIPIDDPLAAFDLLFHGEPTRIDIGRVNDRYFVNMATGGVGALATASTPPAWKKALGGAAYSLHALATAFKASAWNLHLSVGDQTIDGPVVLLAIGNGRQAGGGYHLTADAVVDDGLLDVVVVQDMDLAHFGTILQELNDPGCAANQYTRYWRVPALRFETEPSLPLNLDGEPLTERRFDVAVLPARLPVILPCDSPLIGSGQRSTG